MSTPNGQTPMTVCTDDICIQPQVLELATRFSSTELLQRSFRIAQERHSDKVIAQDLKLAIERMLAELAEAFEAINAGSLLELELTDSQFHALAQTSRIPDQVNPDDDSL